MPRLDMKVGTGTCGCACRYSISDNILSAHDLFGCLERDSALSEPSEAEIVTNAIGFSKKSAELVYCD